jgi:hypothetical protein
VGKAKGSCQWSVVSGEWVSDFSDICDVASPLTTHHSQLIFMFGGIYGFLTPSENAALGPDKWQSFDITLIGRMITVVANGKTIICNQEIPGITGGALDSKEGEPGPIYLQGNHGPVSYRNIRLLSNMASIIRSISFSGSSPLIVPMVFNDHPMGVYNQTPHITMAPDLSRRIFFAHKKKDRIAR